MGYTPFSLQKIGIDKNTGLTPNSLDPVNPNNDITVVGNTLWWWSGGKRYYVTGTESTPVFYVSLWGLFANINT